MNRTNNVVYLQVGRIRFLAEPVGSRFVGICLLLQGMILLLMVPRLTAQQTYAELPQLFRLPDGWFGIDRTDFADRLVLYDSAFIEQAQTVWRGLNPRDFIIPSFDPPSDSTGFLLAHPGPSSVLYRTTLSGPAQLEPFWQSDDFDIRRFVTCFQGSDSTAVIVVAGDSVLLGIHPDGSIAYELRTLVRTHPVQIDSTTWIVLHDIGGTIQIAWIDLSNGQVQTQLPLQHRGEVQLSLSPPTHGTPLLLVTTSIPPTLYGIRLASRGFVDQIPLTIQPDAIVPLDDGRFALLNSTIPTPTVRYYPGNLSSHRLFYPGTTPFRSVLRTDSAIILISATEMIVYDGNLSFRGQSSESLPYDAVFYPLEPDSTGRRWLFSGSDRSVILQPHDRPFLWVWFQKYWGQLIIGLVSLGLLIIAVLAFGKYRRLRSIYNTMVLGENGSGVIVTTRRGKVVRMNSIARRRLGLDPGSPSGRHALYYLSPGEFSEIREFVRQLLINSIPFEREQHVAIDGRKRTMRFVGRRMYSRFAGNTGYLILVEDITDSLERDRLVNWASVAHHIAHEMKTPLGTVRTTAEMLRNDLAHLPNASRALTSTGRIVRQAARLREIVDDLLTVARTEELRRVRVDLLLLLRSLVDDLQEYFPPNCRLIFESDGEDFGAEVDADQLTIAIRNVIDNARQAVGEQEDGRVTVDLSTSDDSFLINITDNGSGMSPETLARLFQPYYTEKEGGSGIGTVIIQRVIHGHGGDIEVESQPGKGTTFLLRIPR